MSTKELWDSKENCPHCKADLQGDPIPPEQQEAYAATHFSRKIGIYCQQHDRTEKYSCPFCDKEWPAIPEKFLHA